MHSLITSDNYDSQQNAFWDGKISGNFPALLRERSRITFIKSNYYSIKKAAINMNIRVISQ